MEKKSCGLAWMATQSHAQSIKELLSRNTYSSKVGPKPSPQQWSHVGIREVESPLVMMTMRMWRYIPKNITWPRLVSPMFYIWVNGHGQPLDELWGRLLFCNWHGDWLLPSNWHSGQLLCRLLFVVDMLVECQIDYYFAATRHNTQHSC